jgi:hypothetical protein
VGDERFRLPAGSSLTAGAWSMFESLAPAGFAEHLVNP